MARASRVDVAYVALGSNLGHRGRNLARLREALTLGGVRIDGASSEVLTRPIGVTAQPDFHNQVLRLRSPKPWSAQQWLAHAHAAEAAAGRRESYHWGPRVADVDLLLLGEHGEVRVDSDKLTVPHAEIAHRPFVQRLLRELGVSLPM